MSEELKQAFDERWGDAIAATHIKALAWEYFQCGWNRRQEAKPLTRAEMIWALAPEWATRAGIYEDQISYWNEIEFEDCDSEGVEWIERPVVVHAAMPPDPSARMPSREAVLTLLKRKAIPVDIPDFEEDLADAIMALFQGGGE